MVAKSGLIPSSPYPPVLTFGWCLDESRGMTMEMEMDFGEGGRGGPSQERSWGSSVIMATGKAGLRENFATLIKTLQWPLGITGHQTALQGQSCPVYLFTIRSSLAFQLQLLLFSLWVLAQHPSLTSHSSGLIWSHFPGMGAE